MEKLTQLKDEGLAKIEQCGSASELQALRVLYLGKKGPIQEVMKSMKDLPKEERPAFGAKVNEVKALFASAIEERKVILDEKEL
ncbi:MAG: phenylalanine--tRNA ligase subunit alpha, partial [Longicatena sp.]|nr:phenylalanine--tRNA ligase subunit alpha [Longicatena sp.]